MLEFAFPTPISAVASIRVVIVGSVRPADADGFPFHELWTLAEPWPISLYIGARGLLDLPRVAGRVDVDAGVVSVDLVPEDDYTFTADVAVPLVAGAGQSLYLAYSPDDANGQVIGVYSVSFVPATTLRATSNTKRAHFS